MAMTIFCPSPVACVPLVDDEVEGIGTVLLQQGGLAEVSSVATGGQDDGAVDGHSLAVELVGDTGDVVALLVDGGDTGLLDDLNTVGLLLGELLESLHQGVCDGHAGELGIVATVRSGLGVTTIEH